MNTQDTLYLTEHAKMVIICAHGFINNNRHDLTDFKEYFDRINTKPNLEVVPVFLYDPQDKKTYKHKKMTQTLLAKVKEYADNGYIIYLLGYSFSAGICAHVASVVPQVRKLILVAPTIFLIKTKLLGIYLKVAYKNIKLRIKHGKKAARIMERMKTKGVIRLSFNIALATFRERKWFRKVPCKTMMLKGSEDSFASSNTFHTISKRIKKASSTMKIYPKQSHLMILHYDQGKSAFDDILSFTYHFKFNEESEYEEDLEFYKNYMKKE